MLIGTMRNLRSTNNIQKSSIKFYMWANASDYRQHFPHYIAWGSSDFDNTGSYCGQALATSMHALCAIASRSLDNHSPGKIAFNHHMFLNVPILAELHTIQKKWREIILKNLMPSNQPEQREKPSKMLSWRLYSVPMDHILSIRCIQMEPSPLSSDLVFMRESTFGNW